MIFEIKQAEPVEMPLDTGAESKSEPDINFTEVYERVSEELERRGINTLEEKRFDCESGCEQIQGDQDVKDTAEQEAPGDVENDSADEQEQGEKSASEESGEGESEEQANEDNTEEKSETAESSEEQAVEKASEEEVPVEAGSDKEVVMDSPEAAPEEAVRAESSETVEEAAEQKPEEIVQPVEAEKAQEKKAVEAAADEQRQAVKAEEKPVERDEIVKSEQPKAEKPEAEEAEQKEIKESGSEEPEAAAVKKDQQEKEVQSVRPREARVVTEKAAQAAEKPVEGKVAAEVKSGEEAVLEPVTEKEEAVIADAPVAAAAKAAKRPVQEIVEPEEVQAKQEPVNQGAKIKEVLAGDAGMSAEKEAGREQDSPGRDLKGREVLDAIANVRQRSMNVDTQETVQAAEGKQFASVLNRVDRLQNVINRFDQLITNAVNSGENKITISLIPRNLGELTVSCRESGGEIVLEIVAENKNVRGVLNNHETFIREAVENSGFKLGQFDVRTRNGDAGGNRFTGQNSGAGSSGMAHETDEELVEIGADNVGMRHGGGHDGFWYVA